MMMVVATIAMFCMGMAMSQFVLGGHSNIQDGDIEVQGFACQGVVSVDNYLITVYCRNRDDLSTIAGLGMELGARNNLAVVHAGKHGF